MFIFHDNIVTVVGVVVTSLLFRTKKNSDSLINDLTQLVCVTSLKLYKFV